MKRSRFPGFIKSPRAGGLFVALAVAATSLGPVGSVAAATGIERVSLSNGEAQRNIVPTGSTTSCAGSIIGKCTKRTVSSDGKMVVFASKAPNLVANDTNGTSDIFLARIDTVANKVTSVTRVSVHGAIQGDGDSETPSISPNGQYVAFQSTSTNWPTKDNKIAADVFVYRVADKTLHLASVGRSNAPASQESFSPSVADDGSVVFQSFANNMVSGVQPQFQVVYLRRFAAGGTGTPSTVLVSQSESGDVPDGPSLEPYIDGSGTKVVFTSAADNMVSPEPDGAAQDQDIFVFNATDSSVVRITTDAQAFGGAISADGSKIAFSAEKDLASGDSDVVRKDVYTAPVGGGAVTHVSNCGGCSGTTGATSDKPANVPSISDGGKVSFQSQAQMDGAPTSGDQVWLGDSTRVSKSAAAPADADAEFATISGDGNWVSFTSAATNLVPSDANGSLDVFLKNLVSGALVRVSVGPGGREASGFSTIPASAPAISGSGTIVAFESDSSNLVAGDRNGVSDIFVRDRVAKTTQRVSLAVGGKEANGASANPSISANGRLVAFESTAALTADDTNGVADVFVADRQTGAVSRISRNTLQEQALPSIDPHISANGKYVAFESAGQFSNVPTNTLNKHIYRYDRAAKQFTLVTVNPANDKGIRKAASRDSFDPSVADDGSVAFLSENRGMVIPEETGTGNNAVDVFVARGTDGFIQKASVDSAEKPAAGTKGSADSFDPMISADGTKVVFTSRAQNLAPDTNVDTDIFMRDVRAGTTTKVSIGQTNNGAASGASGAPSLNRDGSLVAFASTASNLVDGDTANQDVFLASPGGEVRRISQTAGAVEGNGFSYTPAISSDGKVVAFHSAASNLVGNDTNLTFDTFVDALLDGEVPQTCPPVCTNNPGGPGGPKAGAGSVGGYRFVASDGGIFSYGTAGFYGSMGGQPLAKPIVGMTSTPSNLGYWLVASDGGIFSFGDAGFFGSTGDIKLNSPIVAMASTPSGNGYWFVAADGGIFSFGPDAGFHGSMGGQPLNKPIVAMAVTPSGKGYWLVASDGGIFSFGDAEFFGSTGSIALNKPIVGMDRTASGQGYRFVASDGGIFSYGDASFLGSMGGSPLNKPIVGMAKSRVGDGYYLVASDGGVFAYGSAPFEGSTGAIVLAKPIVGMAG